MKDKQGREYAKLSQIREGDMIEIDGGFTCAKAGLYRVYKRERGLAFECAEHDHYISGQADNGEDLIGIYPTKEQPK